MITYTDKVQNAVNPLPVTEQFRAVDANEIKNKVNANITATSAAQSDANQALSDAATAQATGAAAQVTANLAVSDFIVLVDGATVTWNTDSKKIALAKLTSTQSFTLDMTNVASGSQGIIKITTGTTSAITITFDTDFTNKRLGIIGEESFTTFTLVAATSGKEYLLGYTVEGTTIHWIIPNNIPQWTNFTQTFVGFSGSPTYTCRYLYDSEKKLLHMNLYVDPSAATGTTFTFQLPIAASANNVHTFQCQIHNNSVNIAGLIQTATNSTTVTVYASVAYAAVSGANNRGIRVSFTIETI